MSSVGEPLSGLMAESISFSVTSPEFTQLPKFLLSRILLRLPLKSLARSRCVSKSWNDVISSPEFIDQHINSARFESDGLLVLSKFNKFPLDDDPLYDLYSPPFNPDSGGRRLKPPPSREEYGSFPIGVVHGVVCIFRLISHPPERSVIFWNPSIDKHVTIPMPHRSMIEGFGYDPITKQLKVVTTRKVKRTGFQVEVIAHRDRRWRRVKEGLGLGLGLGLGIGLGRNHFLSSGKEDMVFDIPSYDGNVNWLRYDEGNKGSVVFEHYYFQGHIHWLRYKGEEEGWILMAFDCAKEEIKPIDLPRELAKCKAPMKFIWGPRGGCGDPVEFDKLVAARCGELFTVQHMETGCQGCDVHIWVMCEYGVVDTWMKLYTIPSVGPFANVKMVWEEEEVVLWFMGVVNFCAYDFTASVVKRVIQHPDLVFDAYAFKETLLLMDV